MEERERLNASLIVYKLTFLPNQLGKGSRISSMTPRNLLPRLLVLLPRLPHNLLAHHHAFLPLQPFPHQPVPQKLLVETLLRPPNLIVIPRPEPGRIRGQDLVGQDNMLAFPVEAEFEFGIGDDQAARKGVFVGDLVDLEREGGNR